jgi:hypothetical protein
MNSATEKLLAEMPLMKCSNKAEFRQRLQWLSEGMLQNRLEGVIHYTINKEEIAAYRRYKEELSSDQSP